jgi:hypothetical protein
VGVPPEEGGGGGIAGVIRSGGEQDSIRMKKRETVTKLMKVQAHQSMQEKQKPAKAASLDICNENAFVYDTFGVGDGEVENKGCEDAPQCTGLPMLPPIISLQIQPNGFAGYDLCGSSNPNEIKLGIFGLVPGQNAVAPFSVDACFDQKVGKWHFSVPEIKLNAIEDICTSNINANGLKLISSCSDVPSYDSERAKKDLMLQKTYGAKGVKYISTQATILHEERHKRDYLNIINSLRPQWEKLFNEIQPACKEFKNLVDATQKGMITVKSKITPFMEEFDERFSEQYYNQRKANPNSPDYDPMEKARKDVYEVKTQQDLLVQLSIDDLIQHIPCN